LPFEKFQFRLVRIRPIRPTSAPGETFAVQAGSLFPANATYWEVPINLIWREGREKKDQLITPQVWLLIWDLMVCQLFHPGEIWRELKFVPGRRLSWMMRVLRPNRKTGLSSSLGFLVKLIHSDQLAFRASYLVCFARISVYYWSA